MSRTNVWQHFLSQKYIQPWMTPDAAYVYDPQLKRQPFKGNAKGIFASAYHNEPLVQQARETDFETLWGEIETDMWNYSALIQPRFASPIDGQEWLPSEALQALKRYVGAVLVQSPIFRYTIKGGFRITANRLAKAQESQPENIEDLAGGITRLSWKLLPAVLQMLEPLTLFWQTGFHNLPVGDCPILVPLESMGIRAVGIPRSPESMLWLSRSQPTFSEDSLKTVIMAWCATTLITAAPMSASDFALFQKVRMDAGLNGLRPYPVAKYKELAPAVRIHVT